ncbi:MAG: DEAD/DEAH box helicase family protein, partial [Lachnospira sp.]|nr:DEAD/DEAH box helicase family protein [Lachnospira sp.]
MYADIIVDISHEQLDKTFQYAVPPALQETVKPGVMVNIPFGKGNRLITGYVIELSDTPKCDICRIKEIDSVAENRVQAVERMIQLAAWLKSNYGSTMNQALKTVLPVKEKVRHKEKKTAKLIITKEEAEGFKAVFEKKHATAKLRLLNALCEEDSIDCDVIRNKLNITMQTVNSLQADGILEVEREELYRNPIKETEKENTKLVLNEQQKYIVDSIINDYDSGVRNTYLIHGITGSGKTLCYIELIEHVVAMGKQVIMLIPEIALTFQTVQRFYKRFGNSVSILNSRMSKGERFDQLLKAMRGEISIIIGPRSALFTPFMNLGLIVIDEEHEGAYKSEQAPRYHARETAVHIAKTCNA